MENRDTNWIKASPEALGEFYRRCNTEMDFREGFLENPEAMLNRHGIEVGPDALEEIERKIEELYKQYGSEIGSLPDWEEHGVEVLENGWGLWFKDSEHSGAIP